MRIILEEKDLDAIAQEILENGSYGDKECVYPYINGLEFYVEYYLYVDGYREPSTGAYVYTDVRCNIYKVEIDCCDVNIECDTQHIADQVKGYFEAL